MFEVHLKPAPQRTGLLLGGSGRATKPVRLPTIAVILRRQLVAPTTLPM
jgi:hypothetical protein